MSACGLPENLVIFYNARPPDSSGLTQDANVARYASTCLHRLSNAHGTLSFHDLKPCTTISSFETRSRLRRRSFQVLVPERKHIVPIIHFVRRTLEQMPFPTVSQIDDVFPQPLHPDEHLIREWDDRFVVAARLNDQRRRDAV